MVYRDPAGPRRPDEFYTDRAARGLTAIHANADAHPAQLAQVFREWREEGGFDGLFIAADGSVADRTHWHQPRTGAASFLPDGARADMSTGRVSREHGQRVIHVTMDQVWRG